MDKTIYKLLLWSLPIFLGIISFIGILAVNSIISLSSEVHQINTSLQVEISKRDDLEKIVQYMQRTQDDRQKQYK